MKQKNVERLKIQESEILESLQALRTKIYKCDLDINDKDIMDGIITSLEETLHDYYATEYFKIKKIGNS